MMPGTPDLSALKPVLILYGILFLVGLSINVWFAFRYLVGLNPWPVKVNRLSWRPWYWRDMVHILIALAALHILVLGVLRTIHLLGWLDPEQEQWVWVIAHSVALHWAALAIVVFIAWRRRMSWASGFSWQGARWWRDAGFGALAYVAAVPALVFYAALYHLWLQGVGHEPQPQDVVRFFISTERGLLYFYLLGLAVIIAPISEEVLFRGILLPALSRQWGIGWAIVVSSILFALVHFHIPSMVPLFVFAVALSLA